MIGTPNLDFQITRLYFYLILEGCSPEDRAEIIRVYYLDKT